MVPLKALAELRNFSEHRCSVRGYERSLYRFLVRSICQAFEINERDSTEVDSRPGRYVPDITFLYKNSPWAVFEVKPGSVVSSEKTARAVFQEKLKYVLPTMRYFFLTDQRTLYRWDLSGTFRFEDARCWGLHALCESGDVYKEAFGCFLEMLDSEAADRGFLELLRNTNRRTVSWHLSIPEAKLILKTAVQEYLQTLRAKTQEVKALVLDYREIDEHVPEYGINLTGDDPFAWANQRDQVAYLDYNRVQEVVEPFAPYVQAFMAAKRLSEKDTEVADLVTDYVLAILIDDRCYDSYTEGAGIFSSYALQCQMRGEQPMNVIWGRLRKCPWLKAPPALLRLLDSADTKLSAALLRAMLCINGTNLEREAEEAHLLRAARGTDPLWKSLLDPFCGEGQLLSLVVSAGVQQYKQTGFKDPQLILEWLEKARGYTGSAHCVPITRFRITEAVARELPGIDRETIFKNLCIEHKEVSAADLIAPADIVVCRPPAERIQGRRKRKLLRYHSLSDMMRQKERLRPVWGMANKTVDAASVILNGEDKLLNDRGAFLLILPRSSLTSLASEDTRRFWSGALTQVHVHDNGKLSEVILLGNTATHDKIRWIDEYGAREVDRGDILSGSYRKGPPAIVPPDPTPTKVFQKMHLAGLGMHKPSCSIPLEGVKSLKDPNGDLDVMTSGNIRPWGVSGPPKMRTSQALLSTTTKINRHHDGCHPEFVAVRTHPFLRLCPHEKDKIFSNSTLFIEIGNGFPLHVYCCSRLVQAYLANYFSNGHKEGRVITWGKAILDHFPLPLEIGGALKELGKDIERLDRQLALGRKDLVALCDTPLQTLIGKKVFRENDALVVKDPMFEFIVSGVSERQALQTLVPVHSYEQAFSLYKVLTDRPRLKEEFQEICLKLEHLVGRAFGLSRGEVEDALAILKTRGMPFLQRDEVAVTQRHKPSLAAE